MRSCQVFFSFFQRFFQIFQRFSRDRAAHRNTSAARIALVIILSSTTFAGAESLKDRREGTPFVVAGDVLQIALPTSVFAYSLAIRDWEGARNGALSFGAALATTHALKWAVGRPRPYQDRDERGTSFPSGHTTAAFVGAAQWQRRYGWAVGAPAYALAAATGYSRVWGGWHYWGDVAAGAAIGIAAPYIFTKSYERVSISGGANHINISWSF